VQGEAGILLVITCDHLESSSRMQKRTFPEAPVAKMQGHWNADDGLQEVSGCAAYA
jgi:hypothetical protein